MDSLIPLAGEWDNVTMVENIDQPHVIANVDAALALGLPELTVQPGKDVPLLLCGGGPSLADDMDEVAATCAHGVHVWVLNGVHDYMLSHGITPNGMWCVDSRVDNVRFFKHPQMGCDYYIASRCDLAIFTALLRYSVILWHDATCRKLVPEGKLIVSGGTTIGMKALAGAYACGYREIHLFGYDSSYRDDDHHAYPMPMNDGISGRRRG
jgi:hypothetical protein